MLEEKVGMTFRARSYSISDHRVHLYMPDSQRNSGMVHDALAPQICLPIKCRYTRRYGAIGVVPQSSDIRAQTKEHEVTLMVWKSAQVPRRKINRQGRGRLTRGMRDREWHQEEPGGPMPFRHGILRSPRWPVAAHHSVSG